MKHGLKFAKLLTNSIRFLFWIFILINLFGLSLKYIANVSQYPYLHSLIKFEKTMNSSFKSYVPTQIKNTDLSRPIMIVFLLVGISIVIRVRDKILVYEHKQQINYELQFMKHNAKTDEQNVRIDEIQAHFAHASNFRGKSYHQLLKDFVSIKKELEKSGRYLAFLAIDVVDSVGMKQGEDPIIVQNDFNLFHDFIVNKLKENGYIKAAWTPDGVMACFTTTEQAISAAKSILKDLEDFNKNLKLIARNFAIRCGINSGFVYYDSSIPLEKFTDKVIDIAGHMQKHAKPNTIYLAKDIVQPITAFEDFCSTSHIIDGFEVWMWESK